MTKTQLNVFCSNTQNDIRKLNRFPQLSLNYSLIFLHIVFVAGSRIAVVLGRTT